MKFWIAIALSAVVLSGCHRPPAKSEFPDAMVLLRQSRDAMFALKSYSATCFTTTTLDNKSRPPTYRVSTLIAEKPLKVNYHNWPVKRLPDPKLPRLRPSDERAYTISDGFTEISHIDGIADTVIKKIDAAQLAGGGEPWNGFFVRNQSILGDIDNARARGEVGDASYLNSEIVDGVTCDKLLIHIVSTQSGSKSDNSYTYLIGHDDHLVRQVTSHISFDNHSGLLRDAVLYDVKANPETEPSDFRLPPIR